jgi:hypothetical protein
MTGRCLHRIRSCDHHVWSSREKRISPFLTVRSDLDHRVLKILHSSEPSPLIAISLPPPQSSAAAAEPPSTPVPERRRTSPCPRPCFPRPRPRCAPAPASSPFRRCSRAAVPPRRATACPCSPPEPPPCARVRLPEHLHSRAALAEQPRAPET